MSVAAVKLAYQQNLPGQSSVKFILVTLAQLVHHEDKNWEIYGAVEYLTVATNMNRKTVLKGLSTLRELGYIVDTGKMTGRNRCIPVYRLCFPDTTAEAADNGGSTWWDSNDDAMPKNPPAAGPSNTSLPKLWSLPPTWRAWAMEQRPNWSASQLETTATIFHAYWTSLPAAQGEKPDWFAQWRIWVLRERQNPAKQPPDKAHGSPEPTDGIVDYSAMGADMRRAMQDLEAGNRPGNSAGYGPDYIDM